MLDGRPADAHRVVITGRFGLNFILPMPVVRVSVHLPGITSDYVALDFLLDTGAPNTTVHPRDATVNLGIPWATLVDRSAWSGRAVTAGIGGKAICHVQPAEYLFHHDDGTLQQLSRDIQVAIPTPANATIPSLFGMDILRHFRLRRDYVGQQLVLW